MLIKTFTSTVACDLSRLTVQNNEHPTTLFIISKRAVPYPRDVRLPCDHSLTSSSAGGPVACKDCGRVYKHSNSLALHRKVHEGLTTCSICGSVTNRVADLRAHLRSVHKLTREEIKILVPVTRWRWSPPHPPPS